MTWAQFLQMELGSGFKKSRLVPVLDRAKNFFTVQTQFVQVAALTPVDLQTGKILAGKTIINGR